MTESGRNNDARRLVRSRFAWALAVSGLAWLPSTTAAPESHAGEQRPAPRDVRQVAGELLQLRTFAEGYEVTDRRMRAGHLELFLDGGEVFPLVDGSSGFRGFYFVGRGRYGYSSDDPVDRSVIPRNLGEKSDIEPLGGGRLEGRFQRAVVLHDRPFYTDLRLAEDGRARELRAAPLDPTELNQLREIRELFPSDVPSMLAHAVLDPPPVPFVFATFRTGRESLRYVYDPVQSGQETLSLVRTGPSTSLRLVSAQPIGPRNRLLGPAVVLRHADFAITARRDHTGSIVSDLDLVTASPGVRILPFRLTLDRPPMVWGALPPKEAGVRALRVSASDGSDVPFSFVGGQLLVDLGREVPAGTTVGLRVETEGTLFTGLSGSRRLDYFELMSTDWHPRPVTGVNQRFDYTMTVRTEKPYVPVAPGFDRSLQELDDAWELHVTGRVRVPFTAALGGKFRTVEVEGGPVPVRIHAYGSARRGWTEKLGQTAVEFLRIYEELLGPFPFEGLDVVEIPEWKGLGVAGPGLVLFSAEAFAPSRPGRDQGNRADMINRFAHEIAHQWFGNRLVISSPRDNWLSESFAEYLSALAVREMEKPDGSITRPFRRVLDTWIDEAVQTGGRATVLGANQLGGEDRIETRNALLYRRGPMVLRMLHDLLGDAEFQVVLRRFLDRARDGTVDVADFMQTVRVATGRDLDWFFHQWLGIDGVPQIHVAHEIRSAPGGGVVIEGTLEQNQHDRLKILEVPVVLEMADGTRVDHRVLLDRPAAEFRFEISEMPRRVLFDPERVNLAVWDGPGTPR